MATTTAGAENAATDPRRARRQVGGGVVRRRKSTQPAAEARLARLLSASPAVIYSFRATGDYAPTFVS
jgi:hypothetical protein